MEFFGVNIFKRQKIFESSVVANIWSFYFYEHAVRSARRCDVEELLEVGSRRWKRNEAKFPRLFRVQQRQRNPDREFSASPRASRGIQGSRHRRPERHFCVFREHLQAPFEGEDAQRIGDFGKHSRKTGETAKNKGAKSRNPLSSGCDARKTRRNDALNTDNPDSFRSAALKYFE
ncbi:hypothetical protein MAR_ORF438 [Marseillevirus marseillevirus]|uniref:Uncharacterized protein n=1 Tax=Marseillevirus marseillevirus TaxID=694581 RepID=D2XB73_GBMV|nr:hypothetical protein MAR_ORF438 [Marseillevirus marseillevirus]ADB04200.1 hypothetical protein MAR_ORF438 [Marseillevirus marseillevirus]